MKRLKTFFRSVRHSSAHLIALCYAVFLLASILAVLYGGAEDTVRRMRGEVMETEVPGSSGAFGLTDLDRQIGEDGQSAVYTSLSIDPRMEFALDVLSPTGIPAYVRRVTLHIDYLNMEPGELCIFYKPKPNMEEYDAIYRVWAHKETQAGVYTFTLPMRPVYGLRLDPSIYSGTQFRLISVTLNEPRGLLDRLTPTRPWLLAFAVVPLLAASVIRYILFVIQFMIERRKKHA